MAPTTERKKWKTKEAIGAYCKKCASEINYSSGTSQQILRHMERFHPDDIHSSNKKRAMHQQTIHHSTKKLKMVNESEAQKGHLKILKWIAESYRPLSIVEDPGFNDVLAFVNTLEKKYKAPSRSTMTRLLRSTYDDVMISR